MTTIAYWPLSFLTALRVACSGSLSLLDASSIRCAMTSVSVSLLNTWPSFDELLLQLQVVLDYPVVDDRDRLRRRTAGGGRSPCVTPPWVAHLVWAIPVCPFIFGDLVSALKVVDPSDRPS